MRGDRTFLLGFAAIALIMAAALSYFADPDPDGLESATRQGCAVTETAEGEQLRGRCIAQSEQDHPLSSSPLANYAVGGDERLTGVAGALGVVVTVGVAGGMFWLLRRRDVGARNSGGDGSRDGS